MNLAEMKAKYNSLQQAQAPKQRVDMTTVFWKPTTGKHTIRMVPSVFNKANPFKELYFHYGIGNLKVAISPINFGEKDPIVEFANEIKKGQYDKDNWALAKKLQPKMRVFAPVIVRGEEDKGVRLWEFGKEVYMELLAIAEDEDVLDYTDPITGRDLTVEKLDAAASGNSFGKTNIRVRTKSTVLSEDANQVQTWLTTQPDPMAVFKRYEYDAIKANLLEFLNPGEEPATEVLAAETAPVAPEAPKQAYTLEAKPKKSVDDEFDALFS